MTGIKYIGDLSRADAALLARYAGNSRAVLEFGVGGSTQVIAQSLAEGSVFISLDTDPGWIMTTQENLRRLGVGARCNLRRYDEWPPAETARFDLIFDDGADHLRIDFALRSFPLLTIGGALLFHDTRRLQDVRNVSCLVETFFEEIDLIHLNERIDGVSSNITVIRKKAREPYADWNDTEARPAWAIGYGPVPEDFWLKRP
jgi:hypothetical protein